MHEPHAAHNNGGYRLVVSAPDVYTANLTGDFEGRELEVFECIASQMHNFHLPSVGDVMIHAVINYGFDELLVLDAVVVFSLN